MQVAGLQVVPVRPGDHVAEGIGVGVQHHLGHPRGAAGEEDDHGFLAAGRLRRAGKFLCAGGLERLVVQPARRGGGVARARGNVHQDLQVRALGLGRLHPRGDGVLADDTGDVGEVHAELDVVRGQQRGRGDGQRADAAQGQHGDPVLHAPIQDDHDPVALGNALGRKGAGQLGRLLLEEAKAVLAAGPTVIHMDHGQGLGVGVGVQEVVGEVVVGRYVVLEVRHEVAVTGGTQFFHIT